MTALSTDSELHALMQAAIDAGREHYIEAIAAQVEREPADHHWRAMRATVARAWLLSELIGEAGVVRRAQRLGAVFDFTDDPVEVEKFDRLSETTFDFGDDDSGNFIAGPFREAIQAFDRRVPRLKHRVRTLAETARQVSAGIVSAEQLNGLSHLAERSNFLQSVLDDSFWAQGLNIEATGNLRALLADVIRGQPTGKMDLPEFIDAAQLRGAAGLSRARLETIFRNNLNSAFNEGQSIALRDENVRRTIPLVMISEIQDGRSRPTHKAMHGYVNTVDEIDRLNLRPPNGHQCRGGIRGVSKSEAARLGLLNDSGYPDPERIAQYNGERQRLIDRGLYPDPGFKEAA